MDTIRAAIVGFNNMGKEHARVMHESKRFTIAAICDINEKARETATANCPEAAFYTTTGAMLTKEKLDLLVAVVPHNVHVAVATEALSAGVNVIVEKPMATRYSDAQAIISAARKANRFATVFHNRRWDPWFMAARSVINDGLLGTVAQLDIAINYRPSLATWRGYKEASGGLMFDWGAHFVDWALNLVNSRPKAVSGFNYRKAGSDPLANEDHCTVRVYFENGGIANATVSGLDQSTPLRYRIVGEKATLTDEWIWEDGKAKVFSRLSSGEKATTEVAYGKAANKGFYENLVSHMTEGTPLAVSAESGAQVINVLCTAERSSNAGGAPLPLET
jgi:scyllo-inositol 2-dehydrogenase (NADP+)